MIQWTTVGTYLGRPIRIGSVRTIQAHAAPEQFHDSVVLIFLDRKCSWHSNSEEFLDWLVAASPLAIAFAGKDCRAAFDAAIDLLSKENPRDHIMTKLIEEDAPRDVIEDFTQATWPSEERFDEWKAYSVLVVGDSQLGDLWAAIAALCQ